MTKPVFFMFAGAALASGWWTLCSFELIREMSILLSVFTGVGTIATLIFIGIETMEN